MLVLHVFVPVDVFVLVHPVRWTHCSDLDSSHWSLKDEVRTTLIHSLLVLEGRGKVVYLGIAGGSEVVVVTLELELEDQVLACVRDVVVWFVKEEEEA